MGHDAQAADKLWERLQKLLQRHEPGLDGAHQLGGRTMTHDIGHRAVARTLLESPQAGQLAFPVWLGQRLGWYDVLFGCFLKKANMGWVLTVR